MPFGAVPTTSSNSGSGTRAVNGGGWKGGGAVYADAGTPLDLYGLGIAVTERKRAELALRQAKAAAESANQLKDQVLATLSHELRTPLNAILRYACMLRMDSIAPDKRQRAIEVIERNAVAQNRLIEDLLDMSRITTGEGPTGPDPHSGPSRSLGKPSRVSGQRLTPSGQPWMSTSTRLPVPSWRMPPDYSRSSGIC
jgi:signal transduction histidine kinase